MEYMISRYNAIKLEQFYCYFAFTLLANHTGLHATQFFLCQIINQNLLDKTKLQCNQVHEQADNAGKQAQE